MTTLTTRETALLAGAIASCTKSPVEIDYAKFAARFGFKNSNSSKASWHAIKKKLDRVAAEGGESLHLCCSIGRRLMVWAYRCRRCWGGAGGEEAQG